MSLCLVHFDKDHIAISGDSRGCIKKNGMYFAVDDNLQKIRRIGDKVIFTSGSAWISDNFYINLENSNDHSIEYIQHLTKVLVQKYKQDHNGILENDYRYIELLVATFENGKALLYSISSKENFKIQIFEGTEEPYIATVGTYTDEARIVFENRWDNPNLSGYNAFLKAYETVADERVGGTLTIYLMTANNINEIKLNIADKKTIKRANEVMLDATHGIVVTKKDSSGKELVKTIMNGYDPTDGIAGFKIQVNENNNMVNKFYVDTNGNLKAKDIITDNITINSGTLNLSNLIVNGQLSASNIDVDTITIGNANITGTLSADKLNLNQNLKGVNVNENFKIDNAGNVDIKGNIKMNGGEITGTSKIEVSTDVKIGKSLVLSETSASGGIRWGAEAFAPAIYREPITGRMDIDNQGKPIYANGIRIDQPVVAVFG